MIQVLSGACAGNQEGESPSWTFPRGTGDGGPRSAACFYRSACCPPGREAASAAGTSGVAWQKAPLCKGGRLRAPPGAEKASKKEWQWSKFCERMRAKNFGYHDRRPKRQRRLVGGGHALGTTGAGARRATEGSSAETSPEALSPGDIFLPDRQVPSGPMQAAGAENAFPQCLPLPPFRGRLPGGGGEVSSTSHIQDIPRRKIPPGLCHFFRRRRRSEISYGNDHHKRTGPGADPGHRQE